MKKGGKIAVVVILSTVLLCGIAAICVMMFSNMIFDTPIIGENSHPTYSGNASSSGNSHAGEITGIKVSYVGGPLYAGGQAVADNFVVNAVYDDETTERIDDYSCNILDDHTPLAEGSNTLFFSYGDYSAVLTVDAINIRTLPYAPTYVVKAVDDEMTNRAIMQVEAGTSSYDEILSNVAFTGDSQIKALFSNELISENRVTAEIGVGLDYLEYNYNEMINKAVGKDVLVMHYGINTLAIGDASRNVYIEQYKSLIKRIQTDIPGIRIVVSGIFPVANSIIDQQERFKCIDEYDFSLCEMCMELGIDYYSNNEYITSHQNVFGTDGLHLTKEFYSEYWLKDLIVTLGIN